MAATATETTLSAPPTLPANPLAVGVAAGSSTSPTDPDCERVNIVLDQLLEGRQLAEADEDYLIHHADDCSPCFKDLKKQQFFISFLSDKVARRPTPDHLHGSILARVRGEMG